MHYVGISRWRRTKREFVPVIREIYYKELTVIYPRYLMIMYYTGICARLVCELFNFNVTLCYVDYRCHQCGIIRDLHIYIMR